MLIVNLMLTVLQELYIELEMVQEEGERERGGVIMNDMIIKH